MRFLLLVVVNPARSKIRYGYQDAASLPIIEPNRECEFSLESNGSFDQVARMRAIMFANGQP